MSLKERLDKERLRQGLAPIPSRKAPPISSPWDEERLLDTRKTTNGLIGTVEAETFKAKSRETAKVGGLIGLEEAMAEHGAVTPAASAAVQANLAVQAERIIQANPAVQANPAIQTEPVIQAESDRRSNSANQKVPDNHFDHVTQFNTAVHAEPVKHINPVQTALTEPDSPTNPAPTIQDKQVGPTNLLNNPAHAEALTEPSDFSSASTPSGVNPSAISATNQTTLSQEPIQRSRGASVAIKTGSVPSLSARLPMSNNLQQASSAQAGQGAKTNRGKELQRHLIERIHRMAIDELKSTLETEQIQTEVDRMAQRVIESEGLYFSRSERQRLVQEVLDEVIGFGPIMPLIQDESVSEIMVNGPVQVYVERKGKLERTDVTFRDNDHVLHIIEKIVAPLGRRIDESMPMVDARLPDGSRVNAIIPPLALNGPTITIRKFAKDPLKIEDLIRFGTLTPDMAKFLDACVKARLNVVVSGGTGSGKTTTLNVLSSFIPSDERIVTIEDAAELQLRQDHVITLETRPPNIEGKGAITMRDLVRNSLRMRPERIVVGEVRGGEALDMLQAMNTGHDGSLTTGHANSPRDMLARLETMVLMAGMELPVRAIREQVSSAIELIVQQNRLRDGSRKITQITEVIGMEGDVITLQDLFVFDQKGVDDKGKVIGKHTATGIKPKFMEKLEASGFKLADDLFWPRR